MKESMSGEAVHPAYEAARELAAVAKTIAARTDRDGRVYGVAGRKSDVARARELLDQIEKHLDPGESWEEYVARWEVA